MRAALLYRKRGRLAFFRKLPRVIVAMTKPLMTKNRSTPEAPRTEKAESAGPRSP